MTGMADADMEDNGAGRWLTYAEFAELRRISKPSAIRMVHRRGWQRQPGNDGTARVLVPQGALRPPLGLPGRHALGHTEDGSPPPDTAPGNALLAGALAALEDDAVAEMRQRAEAAEHRTAEAERRADAALALADQSVAMLTDATARADRAEDRADGLRRRVDELEINLEAARVEAQQVTETAAALVRDE